MPVARRCLQKQAAFLSDLLADTKYACNKSGKRLPNNFTAFVLPRRKALGVKWNQMFSVVLESDLHCHLVPAQCVAAHAAGFAVSRPKPCCADRLAYGQSAVMNGVSRVPSEHSFFQHVFSTIGFESETPAGNVRILSLLARATAIWGKYRRDTWPTQLGTMVASLDRSRFSARAGRA